MMTKNKSNVLSLWKYALAVPMIGVLFITFSCKESVNSTSISENTQETTIESKKIEDPDYSDLDKQNALLRAEEMPRFPGCEEVADLKERSNCSEQKLLQYIYNNLKYPNGAREAGIEGQCVAKFIVNTEGKIQDIRILRDIGGGCGEAVKQVIFSMNDMPTTWIAGKQSGKAVNVIYTLPVKFALADDEKSLGMNNIRKSLDIREFVQSESKFEIKTGSDVAFKIMGQETKSDIGFKKGDITILLSNITLVEDEDYVVNYSTGTLKILKPDLTLDNVNLNISFKN